MNRSRFAINLLLIFSACILVFSGSQNNDLQIKRDNSSSKFRREIPGNYTGYYLINSFYHLPQKLGLNDLSNGFDGLQIRIWYGKAFSDTVSFVSLKLSNKKWTAMVGDIALRFDEVRCYEKVKAKGALIFKHPKSNWVTIEKAIVENDILNLPDYRDVSGYSSYMPTDSDVVTVEVADNNNYRIFAYPSVGGLVNKFNSAKNLVHFLDVLNREFDYTVLK